MNYVDLIKVEFLKRRQANPFYSLRRYAKDLGLNPMHLSNLLKGKRGLSKDSAMGVARELGLKTSAAQRFRFLVSAQSGRGIVERNAAKQGLRRKWIQEADEVLRKRLGI